MRWVGEAWGGLWPGSAGLGQVPGGGGGGFRYARRRGGAAAAAPRRRPRLRRAILWRWRRFVVSDTHARTHWRCAPPGRGSAAVSGLRGAVPRSVLWPDVFGRGGGGGGVAGVAPRGLRAPKSEPRHPSAVGIRPAPPDARAYLARLANAFRDSLYALLGALEGTSAPPYCGLLTRQGSDQRRARRARGRAGALGLGQARSPQ